MKDGLHCKARPQQWGASTCDYTCAALQIQLHILSIAVSTAANTFSLYATAILMIILYAAGAAYILICLVWGQTAKLIIANIFGYMV